MGQTSNRTAPINEAVNLIASADEAALSELKARLPALDLRPGIVAGETDQAESRPFLEDKAIVIGKAADVAESLAERKSSVLKRRIVISNRVRLSVQIITIVSSASVLGTLIANQDLVAKITSAITTMVAVLGVIADRNEQLLSRERGSIFDAYDKLTKLLIELRQTRTMLDLSIKHRRPLEEIDGLITKGNEILEGINLLAPQL